MTSPTIGDVVRQGDIAAVYQPIVDLQTGDVVAYEALARGPVGSGLERPDRLFAAAREAGLLAELDWACRAAAVEGALARRLRPPLGLFVNVEPAVLATRSPTHLLPLWEEALRSLRVTVEVTERALVDDPAGLLAAVARARELGWSVALDDVGAHPDSVALMPFLQPDVIKLDLSLVQGRPDREVAKVVNAVLAQAEATGARILAEGVETEEHLAVALATSASLGQGWYFGRPQPVLPTLDSPETPLEFSGGPRLERQRTPFELVAGDRKAIAPKRVMQAMSLHLERNAFVLPERPVILSTFQDVGFFTADTRRRYAALSRTAAFVAAMGVGIPPEPEPGVRGADLAPDTRLRGEWNVVVVGPHFASALSGHDLGDGGDDDARRFEYAITHERRCVLTVARRLMTEVVPAAAGEPIMGLT
jgi:EAL domain-containing protein (putative c-di-GMP-specific phosphodiesterase class I)